MLRREDHEGLDELTAARRIPRSPRVLGRARVVRAAQIEISSPTVGAGAAGREFGDWLAASGYRRVFTVFSRHGVHLARAIDDVVGVVRPPARADHRWVKILCNEVRASDAETIVAIGGGRCLDLAKLAAARCDLSLVVVPTQLSHDGICSQVSVVPDGRGITQSVVSTGPRAAFFSLATLAESPLRSLRAGIGDLLTNPFALRDWELAATTGVEEMDDDAWHLSMESMGMIEPSLEALDDIRIRRPAFLGLLCHALANSGVAMMLAGSSRPASGAEHKISHAIDLELGGRALHGEQVAFASIISAALHGLSVGPLVRLLAKLQLPSRPEHLGLSKDELVRAILAAPATRPGRFTVLEKAKLDRGSAADLVDGLWGRS